MLELVHVSTLRTMGTPGQGWLRAFPRLRAMVQNSPKAATTPAALPPKRSSLDRYFAISRRGSTIGTEIRGGLVTFVTTAYIIALNPLIIGTVPDVNGNLISGAPYKVDGEVSGANIGAAIGMVAAATALIAALMTILMGVYARFPIGLATGLGINALLAASIVTKMSWSQAVSYTHLRAHETGRNLVC